MSLFGRDDTKQAKNLTFIVVPQAEQVPKVHQKKKKKKKKTKKKKKKKKNQQQQQTKRDVIIT